VIGLFDGLTDPDIPAANKTNIVTPGFSPDEAGTIDDHLNRMRRPALPLHFVVTNVQAAPNNFAGATLATVGNPRQSTYARPIVLVDQGGPRKFCPSDLRFSGGAKGIRTPDPHTASVVRYQLRHSPRRRAHRSYTTACQPSKSLIRRCPRDCASAAGRSRAGLAAACRW
jgi:hypothetical protein